MADLIVRLESAKVGTRELSDEALLAVGFERAGTLWVGPGHRTFMVDAQPDPTRSVDDALKWMVPEGWWWVLNSGLSQHGVATALLGQEAAGNQIEARGHSPALAATAAGLKAKEAG